MDALVRPVVDPGFAAAALAFLCGGVALGTASGLVPGLHANNFALLLAGLAPSVSADPLLVGVAMLGAGVVHSSSTSCPRSRSASRTRPRPSPRYRATGCRGGARPRGGPAVRGRIGAAVALAVLCDSDHVGHDPRLPRREEPPPAAFGRCGRFSCAYRVVEAGRDRRARRLPRERRARLCNPRCRPRGAA